MWKLEELDGEMGEYFSIIEEEAKELREKIGPPCEPSFDDNAQGENSQEGGQSGSGHQNPEEESSEVVADENESVTDWTAEPKKKHKNVSPKEAENPDQNPDQNSDQNRPAQNDNNNNIIDDDANQQQNQPADNNGAQDGPTQNGAQNTGIKPDIFIPFRSPNYDLYLPGYTESERQTIRHIDLFVRRKSELIEYATKILECSNLDTPVLIIQEDDQLVESLATQLCNEGFWSVPIINKTTAVSATEMDNANKMFELSKDSLATFRCLITTIKFLRDNFDFFKKRPSVVINFEPIPPRIKYLERWLNYSVDRDNTDPPTPANKEEIYVYHINIPS